MAVSLPIPQRGYISREHTKIISETIKPQSMIGIGAYSQQIVAGDTLFLSSLTIQNVRVGSQYWVAQTSNLANVLATGTQAGAFTDIAISGIACLANPMQVTIRVRLAGYQPFETQASINRSGATAYIIQSIDGAF